MSSYWQVKLVVAGRRRVNFVLEYSHWLINHAPVKGHVSKKILAAQTALDGVKTKGHKVGLVGKGVDLGKVMGRRMYMI